MKTDTALDCIVKQLLKSDFIAILCHKHPDGDAIGSAFALYRALSYLNKRCAVLCTDQPSENIGKATGAAIFSEAPFEPEFIISVDAASLPLLGELGEICIAKIAGHAPCLQLSGVRLQLAAFLPISSSEGYPVRQKKFDQRTVGYTKPDHGATL